MKTETYNVKRDTPCLKNFREGEKFNLYCGIPSHGWTCWELFKGLDYDITNLKLIEDQPINDTFFTIRARCRVEEKEVNWSHYYSFELWDEQGFIGDYRTEQLEFEENCKLISCEDELTHKEYWETFESILKNNSLFFPNTKNNQ